MEDHEHLLYSRLPDDHGKKEQFGRKIHRQIFLYVFPCFTVIIILLAVFYYNDQKNSIDEMSGFMADDISSMIFSNLSPYFITNDRVKMKHIIEKAVISTNILYCSVIIPDTADIIACMQADINKYYLKNPIIVDKDNGSKTAALVQIKNQHFLSHISSFKVGDNIIILHIVYSQEKSLGMKYNTIIFTFLISLVSIASGIIILHLIIKHVTRPIHSLTDAVKKFSTGKNNVRAVVFKNDEIGQLTDEFNKMTESIYLFQKDVQRKGMLVTFGRAALRIQLVFDRFVNNINEKLLLFNNTGMNDKQKQLVKELSYEMNSLNNTLMDFRNVKEDFVNSKEQINLYELINSIFEDFSHKLPLDSIDIQVRCSKTLEINLNRKQMNSIMYHLIANAIESITSDGLIIINADLIMNNSRLLVLVQDDGIGIDEDICKKVFDPFYSSKIDHLGLGLTIVRRFAGINNGDVTINSVKDSGTIAKLSIPF